MNENLKKVLDKLVADKAYADKMQACKSVEEAYKVATEVAEGFTIEEFKDVMQKINSQGSQGELSAEDLEKVAGGGDTVTTVTTVTSITAASSAV